MAKYKLPRAEYTPKYLNIYSDDKQECLSDRYGLAFDMVLNPNGTKCAYLDRIARKIVIISLDDDTHKIEYPVSPEGRVKADIHWLGDERVVVALQHSISENVGGKEVQIRNFWILNFDRDYKHKLDIKFILEAPKSAKTKEQYSELMKVSKDGNLIFLQKLSFVDKEGNPHEKYAVVSYDTADAEVRLKYEVSAKDLMMKSIADDIGCINVNPNFILDDYGNVKFIWLGNLFYEGRSLQFLLENVEGRLQRKLKFDVDITSDTFSYQKMSSDSRFLFFTSTNSIDELTTSDEVGLEETKERGEMIATHDGFARGYRVNLDTKEVQIVCEYPGRDVGNMLIADKEVLGFFHLGSTIKFTALIQNPITELTLKYAEEVDSRKLQTPIFSQDLSVVALADVENPFVVGFYRQTGEMLKQVSLQSPKHNVFSNLSFMDAGSIAFEGLQVPYYMYTPTENPKTPLPFVVQVHGGPVSRDYPFYSHETEFMVSKGYGVITVNFPGSSGYGRSYIEAGYGEWGGDGKILRSIVAVVKHLQIAGIMSDQVIISGYSFGGHAVYAALTEYPSLFKAGIAGAGPSDLVTKLYSVPDKMLAHWMKLISGTNKTFAEAVAIAASKSPIRKLDAITAPIAIISPNQDEDVDYKKQTENFVMNLVLANKEVLSCYLNGNHQSIAQYTAAQHFLFIADVISAYTFSPETLADLDMPVVPDYSPSTPGKSLLEIVWGHEMMGAFAKYGEKYSRLFKRFNPYIERLSTSNFIVNKATEALNTCKKIYELEDYIRVMENMLGLNPKYFNKEEGAKLLARFMEIPALNSHLQPNLSRQYYLFINKLHMKLKQAIEDYNKIPEHDVESCMGFLRMLLADIRKGLDECGRDYETDLDKLKELSENLTQRHAELFDAEDFNYRALLGLEKDKISSLLERRGGKVTPKIPLFNIMPGVLPPRLTGLQLYDAMPKLLAEANIENRDGLLKELEERGLVKLKGWKLNHKSGRFECSRVELNAGVTEEQVLKFAFEYLQHHQEVLKDTARGAVTRQFPATGREQVQELLRRRLRRE